MEEVVEKLAKALCELLSNREHLNYGFGKSKQEVVDLKQEVGEAVEVVVVGVWLKNLKKCKRKVKKWMKKRTIAT